MSALITPIRVLATGVTALATTVLIEYVFIELWMVCYMWHLGISDKAELSEDYGGAFLMFIVMVIVFFIALLTCTTFIWRKSEQLFTTGRSE